MPPLRGTKTHENLKRAFALESEANRRYLYFAKQADLEGHPDIAGLFRDTAEGEAGHAHGHLEFLAQAGDPASGMPLEDAQSHLRAAIASEASESADFYPAVAKTAREEGFEEIAQWFERLAREERSHASRFQRGLDSLS
jgi:rubrerythrin